MGFPLHPLPTERAPWVPSGQPLTSWSPAWSRRAPASRPRRASPLPAPAGGGTASGARAKVLADSCSGDGPVLRGSTSTGEQSTVPGAWAGRLMWTRPPTPGADPSPPSSDPFPSWAPPGLAIPACPLAPSSPWFACEQAGWGVGVGRKSADGPQALLPCTYLTLGQALKAVVHHIHPVALGDAGAHRRAHGRVHAGRRGPHVQDGQGELGLREGDRDKGMSAGVTRPKSMRGSFSRQPDPWRSGECPSSGRHKLLGKCKRS